MLANALVAAVGLLAAQGPQAEPPDRVIRHAVAAVEGDSLATVEARWARRVARDSADREARLGMAALAQLTYQDSLAERLYRALLPGADGVAGYAAIHLARVLALRGQLLRADSVALTAVAIGQALGHAALTGEALVTFASVRHRTQGAAVAHRLLDSAEAMLPAEALRARAQASCTRAQAYSFAGDRRSMAAATTGIDLATQAGDVRVAASCRGIVAAELARAGELDSATVVYYTLVADYRRSKDRGGLAVALQWRSHLYRSVGWLAKARRDAEESIIESQASGVRAPIPWARSTLARTALALGDQATAAVHAAEATRLFQASGDRYAALVGRGLEGDISAAAGDWAAARSAYTDAMAGSQAVGWAESEINLYRALMHLALREGDLAGAERALAASTARARAAAMHGYVKSATYFEGILALRGGRLAQAERLFRGGRDDAMLLQPQWHYLYAARLAEVLVRQDRLVEAARELTTASQALDLWRRSLRDRDLRLFALQNSEDLADPDLGVATVVHALAAGRRTETGAFSLVERVRARDLADQLTRAAVTDSTAPDRAIRSPEPIGTADLMKALPDDSTAILRFVTGRGGEPTTVFVVTWRDYTNRGLPPEDSLAATIARFTTLLESGEDARAAGRSLGIALLDPALRNLHPAIRRLVIVPDGLLHRIPFDALVLEDGRFAVERYAISYAPSATVAAALWKQRVSTAPSGALVMADPRFAGESNAEAGVDVFRGAVAGHGGLPRLRGAAREARAVARYATPATVRRRDDASEAWFKRAPLQTFGVLHFATHALVDEGSVTNTALALAPGDGEDGFVGPGELLSLRLAADLVVLSACRTAGGALVRGEGVQGLAAPLLAAGARAVAATWWPIGDAASIPMVDDFYRGIASGQPVGAALREAKLAALARGAPAREWAAFTIIGDPLAHPPLHLPVRRPPIAALTAAIVAAALAVYVVARRRRRTV